MSHASRIVHCCGYSRTLTGNPTLEVKFIASGQNVFAVKKLASSVSHKREFSCDYQYV